ncbi:ATP-dependent DNA ligase, partial [Streptomyces sp. SID7499]|nr:ATP-dependent DNA ligase [Streptomyces sp. SID7499]
PRCVIDGEIVVAHEGRLDFERLGERIHPADSRVRLLAEQTPASLIAFDVLAVDDTSLLTTRQADRREVLRAALSEASAPVFLAPATTDIEVAREWFDRY